MSKAGDFEVKAWPGGYPIHVEILYRNDRIARFRAEELPDLAYAIERARIYAKAAAREMSPHENVDAY